MQEKLTEVYLIIGFSDFFEKHYIVIIKSAIIFSNEYNFFQAYVSELFWAINILLSEQLWFPYLTICWATRPPPFHPQLSSAVANFASIVISNLFTKKLVFTDKK